MFANERHKEIMAILDHKKAVKAAALIEYFGVSFETVRRDLDYLEKEGFLRRVHGGAVLDEVNSSEMPFTMRESKNVAEKQEIAEIATGYVSEGQAIALDVSTTNTAFARALKRKFNRLTVITNSLPIAHELAEMPNFTIILAGGLLRNQELCLVGDISEQIISQFYIDIFFMSASGISIGQGITDYGIGEVQIKKQMLKRTQRTIVLADSSKFDVVSMLKVSDFDAIDKVITDSKIAPKVLEKYQSHHIEVITK